MSSKLIASKCYRKWQRSCWQVLFAFNYLLYCHISLAYSMGTLLHAGPSCFIQPSNMDPQASLDLKHRGICYSSLLCKQKGGVPIGKCGLGNDCCVFPQSCNSISVRNSTYFTNPEYPGLSNWTAEQGSARECSITIHRMPGIHPICKFKLDFIEYTLGGQNSSSSEGAVAMDENAVKVDDEERAGDGHFCHSDLILLKAMHTNEHIVPPICPKKVGQHVTIDVRQHIGPFVLTVKPRKERSDGRQSRKWNIVINQLECHRYGSVYRKKKESFLN